MTIAKEIRAHRSAILAGRWVGRNPSAVGEACLVASCSNSTGTNLSHDAIEYVARAIISLDREGFNSAVAVAVAERGFGPVPLWNDRHCGSEQRALEVLEYAEKLAVIDEHRE